MDKFALMNLISGLPKMLKILDRNTNNNSIDINMQEEEKENVPIIKDKRNTKNKNNIQRSKDKGIHKGIDKVTTLEKIKKTMSELSTPTVKTKSKPKIQEKKEHFT